MRRAPWLFAVVLMTLTLGACGDDGNSACERCTGDEDCEAGLTCQLFRDGSGATFDLCGDANPAMTCPSDSVSRAASDGSSLFSR